MRSLLVLAIATSSLAFACSHGTDSTEPEGTVAAAASSADGNGFCTTLCTKQSECDADVDEGTCEKKCQSSVTPVVDKYRADIIVSAQRCFKVSDCKSVLSDDHLGECLSEAELDVTSSAATKDFCAALEASTDKCSNDIQIDHVKCLATMKAYSDATLAEAKKCTAKACNAITDCMDATL